MSSFSKFSDLILAFIFPPIVGFLSGFLFLFYREIFSFRFYDILNKKDGLIPPSDYGSLSSTTAIIVAAMFPVALYVIEKRSDLKYFEEKLDEIFSHNHDEAIENILNYNKGIGEEILHQDQSLKFGIKIFILVSFLSSIFAAALVFLWGPPWFLFREKYAVLLHTIIFSFFCSGIGSMYTKEFSFAFQGPFLRYANYLNNKKYFDRTLKKISLHKDINLDDLQNAITARGDTSKSNKEEDLLSRPCFLSVLKYVSPSKIFILTLCLSLYKIFLEKEEIFITLISMFIVTIIFVVLTCPLDYYSVRIFSCALVYKEIYYERYIAVSILAISNFIKISSLVSFISNQSPTGNLTIFSIIAAVDILIYALSFCCYKRKQGELLRDAIESSVSSVSSLKDNYSLPNELDPLFTEFLYGYIKKNKNFKEMIEMKRRSGLGPEKKE